MSELKKLNNVNIIDVRSIEKYNNNHMSGAINIDAHELLLRPNNYLLKNEKYYIYCQKGVQSKKICSVLQGLGYNVINIIGGYEAWILSN